MRIHITLACSFAASVATQPALDVGVATRFARLALDCVAREYPNKVSHVLQTAEDARPPRALTPAFCGCYDWHSAVHGHWLLVRLARLLPDAPFAAGARAALARSLTTANLAAELAYLQGKGRASFERPYGLAWLLQLAAELHDWKDEAAQRWRAALRPLEVEAGRRMVTYFGKLSHPVRTGEHSQTAFALGLTLDWARTVGDTVAVAKLSQRARDYYAADRGWSFAFEPGGQDFLSPGLAEADVMRRVLPASEFAAWLKVLLPGIPVEPDASWLPVAVVTDKADGKLAHLDGLNLSRAWMLDGIIAALPAADARRAALQYAARVHRKAGLAAVTGEHYEGGHWLGSFATYLVTERGL